MNSMLFGYDTLRLWCESVMEADGKGYVLIWRGRLGTEIGGRIGKPNLCHTKIERTTAMLHPKEKSQTIEE